MLVEQVQARGSVSVDLCHLCLDIALVDGATSIFECFDGLAEVLDGLLVGLFAELIVTLLFEGT